MDKYLTEGQLTGLANGLAPRESFGPNTEFPYIAFDLDCDLDIADWLRDMPCPVIGVGEGSLSAACDVVLPNPQKLEKIINNITKAPMTAMVLVQHLRASEHMSMQDALTAESFAYATVQTGPEFMRWLDNYQGAPLDVTGPPLDIVIHDDAMSITMTQPDTHNAIGMEMRDALCETLDLALMDDSLKTISLIGEGPTFSTGGAIEEFGEVSDPLTAHWIRSLRLPAWRLARLSDRLHVHVNGAAIGAGLEIAAFGAKVTASENAWFQLPELKYGLIPGAGGTVSVARRIGRQRTAYLALSMDRIKARKALEWGLVDAIID